MKNFSVGQTVVVPNGRVGQLKGLNGNEALIWFDDEGNDSGFFSLATLNYPSKPVLVVKG